MSVIVDIADLGSALADRPWGYLLTVGPDLRVHVLAVDTVFVDGAFRLATGRGSRVNAVERPEVTLVFAPVEPGGMSLIVDGAAELADDHVLVRPSKAVLHRAAPGVAAG
ncbi:MAG: pyridoxamine 5'-phosphate oxidase family protein [Ilumatobacteraceae bacterium]